MVPVSPCAGGRAILLSMGFRCFKCFLAVWLALSLGCSNIYEGLSTKDSDEALYEDARKAVNDKDYDTALTKLSSLSSTFLEQRDVKKFYAGALAGKCGLDFITYLSNLSSVDLSSTTLMNWLMSAYKQTVISPAHCAQAETMMMSMVSGYTSAAIPEFTNGEKLFLMILALTKIGVNLRNKADLDSTGNLGDGSMDGTFDPCDNSGSKMTDAEVQQIVSGFAMVLQTFAAFGSSFSSSASNALDSVNDLCAAPYNLTFCTLIDPSSVDATTIAAFREIIATGSTNPGINIGIGSCATNPAVTPGAGGCCPGL